MTALLELKQKIKEIYGQYEMYILPVMKFVLALVYFLWINANMGYMSRLNNVFLVLILALICSILPSSAMMYIGFVLILVHCYALGIEIAELEKAVTGYEQSQKSAEKFIALIDKYENFDTLTNTMLNEFIEKILVHERARKGSQDTTQEIEIYFNFLGRYIPPSLQPVPLTPEEQEELQKKEERKDRLHQNYLRRKASGAQKQYEDKIKAKKKAEMDAKKALIRAEDMKKGVFSTVGQLPKEEPRKGSIAASAAV